MKTKQSRSRSISFVISVRTETKSFLPEGDMPVVTVQQENHTARIKLVSTKCFREVMIPPAIVKTRTF